MEIRKLNSALEQTLQRLISSKDSAGFGEEQELGVHGGLSPGSVGD